LDGGFFAAERLTCGFFFADVFIGVFLHWICQTDELKLTAVERSVSESRIPAKIRVSWSTRGITRRQRD
jgi:hypothetical protein